MLTRRGCGASEQERQRVLDEAERGDHVDLEGDTQLAQGVVGQRGQRCGAEGAGVVHEQVEPAQLEGRRDEVVTVVLVGHVAGHRDDRAPRARRCPDPRGRRLEGGGVPAVDHHRPARPDEPGGQGLPESSRCPCHDRHAHGCPPFRAEFPLRPPI